MASLMSKITRFARSPQGQEMSQKAMRFARSPEGKRKIAQARQRLASKRAR
jgi:hypothetical protein